MKILCFSVTPSPYQRDFFRALSIRSGGCLQVAYFEQTPDDSPWQTAKLEAWESVLNGHTFGKGRVRCHWNSPLPTLSNFDRILINAPLTGLTTQSLFRQLRRPSSPPWAFWGEQLLPRTGIRGAVQGHLAAPLSECGALVAIGRTAQEDYQRRFPHVAVHNIPYACSLSEFEAAATQRQPAEACRFLFAGQMIERKGVDVLLDAFQSLVAENLDIELNLIGRQGGLPGWLAALDETTRKRITYSGFKQPNELPDCFAEADVFILPSRHDGWGVVVNQALGSGLPVITSTAAGAGRDLIGDGVNGLHVSPGDVMELAAAMRELASNHPQRQRMADAAKISSKEIDPEIAAERWIKVLESLERRP